MKQTIKSILAFVALMLCGGAWATQVPYVAFDNSLPTITGSNASSYAIKQSIEANSDGSVTIGADKGLTLGHVNSSCDRATFIIKSSGLKRELANGKAVHVITFAQNNTNQDGGSHNKIGLALNSEGKLQGVWGNQLRTIVPTTQIALQTGDILAITIGNTSGTGVVAWERVNNTWTKVFEDTTFLDSSCHYKGFTLGGPYLGDGDYSGKYVPSTDITPATGWTISNVAMFNSILTEAQVAEYAASLQDGTYRFAPILTASYVDTGWKVSSIDELLAWSFTGEMTGNQTSNQPVAAKGWNAAKHTDGTVTVEFSASSNGKARGVSANFKLEDGVLKVKGVKGAYFNDTNRVIDDMFNNDGSPINPGSTTISVDLATTDSGAGQGLKNIVATPNYLMSNAAQTFARANYNNLAMTFKLPAAPGYADGSKVVVKCVAIATEGSGNNLPAKLAINGVKSSSRSAQIQDQSLYDGTNAGYLIYYNFDDGIELTVGTAASSVGFFNENDQAVTSARFELVATAGSAGTKLSALTINGVTNYAPVCTVYAEPVTIAPDNAVTFSGTLSHTAWVVLGKVATGETISDVALKYGIAAQLGGGSINSGTPLDAVDCYAQVHTDGILTVEMHVQDGSNKKNVLVGFKVESGILRAKWLKGSYKGTTANDRQMTYAENGTISVNSGFTEWNEYEVTKIVVTKADLLNTSVDKPSVLTNNTNLKLHLDASSISNFTILNGEVTQWNDLAGSNNATPAQAKTGNANVTRNGYIEVVNGIPAFQMENVGSGIDLGFTRVTDIRTVFWVMDIKQDYGAFFLGDSTSNCYDFHRGQNGIYASENKPFKNASNVRCDGVTVNQSSDVVPTGLHVYSAKLASNASANRLSQDRDINNRNGGRAISELLIFNSELTDEQIAEVNKYLMKKWTGYKERVATVSADTHWSAIEWIGDADAGNLILTVENAAKITFDALVNCNSLVINGDVQIAADDSLYTDGCYTKALVDTRAGVTVSGAITYDAIKTGFVGAYTKTDTAIELRAQNKEVISINLAGGKSNAETSEAANLVTDANTYYGLAPVPGDKWNNISGRWQSQKTVTLNSAVAYDGTTTSQRDTMSLSATSQNTWNADSLANPFLRGYLDDSGGVTVNVTGIPYTTYDVIVYVTSDDARYALAPITVNGTKYTYVNGEVTVDTGTTDWGVGLQATPVFGKNAMIIRNQSRQDLTIYSTRHSGAGRGTLCAVQVINMGDAVLTRQVFTSTIENTVNEVTLSELTDDDSSQTIVSGELNELTIHANGTAEDAELVVTVDDEFKLALLKVEGDRPVKLVTGNDFANITTLTLTTVTAIRYTNDLSTGTVPNRGARTYEYANATINAFVNGSNAKIHVQNGDTLNITARTAPSLEIEDGATVTIGGADGSLWYGDGTTYVQKGGTVTSAINGTGTSGTGSGLLLGYQNTGITQMAISGGTFTIENSSINFHSCSAMTVSGTGHVKAKGVFKSNGNVTPTVTISESGIFEIGSLGWSGATLTMNGGTFKAYETSIMSAPMTISGASTIEVPEGVTLTITGAVSGTANITKTGAGNLVISGSLENYTGTVSASAGYVASSDYSKVSVSGTAKLLVEETIVEYASGHFTVPTGLESVDFDVLRPTGTIVTKAEVLADTVAKITGIATNFDITFTHREDIGKSGTSNGTIDYAGVSGMNVRFDNAFKLVKPGENGPVELTQDEAVTKETGAHLMNHPYVQNIADFYRNTDRLTFAVVGTMPKSMRTTFIHMGESRTGNDGGFGLLIATGDVKDEVIVAWNEGTTIHELTRMSVPNAATTRHVYIITKDDDRTADSSTFTVYLDGKKWKTIEQKPRFMIIGGLQVGSDFGGIIKDAYNDASEENKKKYFRQSAEADGGVINVIRAYNRIITQEEIKQYSVETEYPYHSPNGSSARTFAEGSANWIETTSVWANTPAEGEASTDTTPLAGASVTATLDGASTIAVNVPVEGASYEALDIAGTGSATFTSATDSGAIRVTGMVTIGRPITVKPGSLDLGTAPITLLEDGTLTFDYSDYDVSEIYTTTKINLTGDIAQDNDKVSFTQPTVQPYHTLVMAYDSVIKQYVLTITPNHEDGADVYINSNTYFDGSLDGKVDTTLDGTTKTAVFPNDTVVFAEGKTLPAWVGKPQCSKIKIAKDVTLGMGETSNVDSTQVAPALDGVTITIVTEKTLTLNNQDRSWSLASVTMNGPGAVLVKGAVSATAIAGDATLKLAEGATLTVGTELAIGRVLSNVTGKSVKKEEVADNKTKYSLIDTSTEPIVPSDNPEAEPVVIEDVGTGIAVQPNAKVEIALPEGATTEQKAEIAAKITVKYGETVLNPAEGTKYVSVTIGDDGAVNVDTTEAATPAVTEMTETSASEVSISFTPVPGLFYTLESGDTPDAFTPGDAEQANSSDTKTLQLSVPTGDAKVKFYRVSVKATK